MEVSNLMESQWDDFVKKERKTYRPFLRDMFYINLVELFDSVSDFMTIIRREEEAHRGSVLSWFTRGLFTIRYRQNSRRLPSPTSVKQHVEVVGPKVEKNPLPPQVVVKGLSVQPPPFEQKPTSHITYVKDRRPSTSTIRLQGRGVDSVTFASSCADEPRLVTWKAPSGRTMPNTPGWTVCGRGVHSPEKSHKKASSPNVANYSRKVGNFMGTDMVSSSTIADVVDTGVVRTTRSPRLHEPFLKMMGTRPMSAHTPPVKERNAERMLHVRARSPFKAPMSPPAVTTTPSPRRQAHVVLPSNWRQPCLRVFRPILP